MELSKDEYLHPVVPGFPGKDGRILPQFPAVVKRFHQLVLDDYLGAVAGFNKSAQEFWVSRFKADKKAKFEEPNDYHINYARGE